MRDEVLLVCDRLYDLVMDALSVDVDPDLADKYEQRRAVTQMISELEQAGLSVPCDLVALEQRLNSALDSRQVANQMLEALYPRLVTAVSEIDRALESIGPLTAPQVGSPSTAITPRSTYGPIIILVLREMGGMGLMSDVLDRLFDKMKHDMLPGDTQYRDGTTEPNWKRNACLAYKGLVKLGHVRRDSPKGIWELP